MYQGALLAGTVGNGIPWSIRRGVATLGRKILRLLEPKDLRK